MSYSIENLSKKFMGLLVGIIIVMVVLIPIVNTAQHDGEDEITYTNVVDTDSILMDLNPMGAHTIKLESNVLTVDDVQIVGNKGYFIATDVFSAYSQESGYMASYLGEELGFIGITSMNLIVTPHHISGSVTYDNGTTQTDNLDIDFLYLADSNGAYYTEYLDMNDPKIESTDGYSLSGSYNDNGSYIYYAYHDGEWYVQNEDYDFDIAMDGQKIEGTTDVYSVDQLQVNVKKDASSGEFNPVIVIIPKEIVGHTEPGTAYTILGVIPVFVILGIILAMTKTFISPKNNRLVQGD